jgi:hypothetical protein
MRFVLVMSSAGHASKGEGLLPDRGRVQLGCRFAALDVFIQDGRHVCFRDFGVPGGVRVDNHGWSLLARAEAGRTADKDFTRHHTLLHEAHVKGHEKGGGSGATAGGFWMAWGTSIGADDDVIFGLRHEFSFYGR